MKSRVHGLLAKQTSDAHEQPVRGRRADALVEAQQLLMRMVIRPFGLKFCLYANRQEEESPRSTHEREAQEAEAGRREREWKHKV